MNLPGLWTLVTAATLTLTSHAEGTTLQPGGILCVARNAPSFFTEALTGKWMVQSSLPEHTEAYRWGAIGSGAQTSKLNPLLPQQPVINGVLNGTTHPSDCITISQMDKVHQEVLGRVSSVSWSSELQRKGLWGMKVNIS